MKKAAFIALSLLITMILFSACTTPSTDDMIITKPSPSCNQTIAAKSLDPIQKPAITKEALPHCTKREYVIVQDYANNKTSAKIFEAFADVINQEIAGREKAEERLHSFGQDEFMIIAAVPFEDGVLICGDILSDGQDYCDLYYFEDDHIASRAMDSDCWSLNYTVFEGYTIAYGASIGWDNGVIMHDKVVAQFANGETARHNFSNIPFKSEKQGWHDEGVMTDGYILIAKGQTWVQNIEFYGKDGSVQDSWRSDLFAFDDRHFWKEHSTIWNTYWFTNMYSIDDVVTIQEITPIRLKIDGEQWYFNRMLLDEKIGMEYLWRNNNHLFNLCEISNASQIEIEGLDHNDEMIWIDLEKDDGSPITDWRELQLDKAPTRKGNYCLVVRHNDQTVLKHSAMYFSIIIRIL